MVTLLPAELLPAKIVTYKDLCLKGLINDLKEAATCDVSTVCRLACHNCPYVLENLDFRKIKIEGLRSYTIKLKKADDGQLLISIRAPDLDYWLMIYELPFTYENEGKGANKSE